MHRFLHLNPNDHVKNVTVGFLVLGTVAGVFVVSVAALMIRAAEFGVFSGPW